MAASEKRPWLICYDIANPRRLGRVHRYLTAHAVPMQYSVLTARMCSKDLDNVLAGLAELIHVKEDDVRVYPLATRSEYSVFGKKYLPEDIELIEPRKNKRLKAAG